MVPTSSSDAPGSQSSHGASKSARILACVLCQHRKIKCDRTFPCANCLKANVTCTPSTPAPARKRRRPNQDLQERLARCEELLKAYASEKPEEKTNQNVMDMTQNMYRNDPCLKWKPPGKLVVEDDGGVRFIDSFMLSTIHEELRAMLEIVDNEDNEDTTPELAATPDENAELVLGGSGTQHGEIPLPATLEELEPSPVHIFRLWQIYLERVNPLTKIIHVPTLQPYLVEATSGARNLPQSVKTLLFAIYTLATVSLTPDECLSMLGCSRETALQRFSNGVRMSLVRTGFLKTYDLETLQALVIYLISLQGRYNRHAAWILNGVVLRIAQKMGLHRDGTVLGLNPFETEIRRRVWWQIILVDVKYALMSGLSHSVLPRVWDTKEPKNINDADLSPTATEPVRDRDGPTEMVLVLVLNRIARFLLETPSVEPMILLSDHEALRGPNGPPPYQVEMYRQLISDLAQNLLEITDKYCDRTAGPLHEAALDVKEEVLNKLEHMLLPAKEREFGDEVKTLADNVFQVAVEATTHDMEHRVKSKDKIFAWFSRLYFQDSMFMFIVGQLCIRTTGRLVEKAWTAVELTYENYPDLFDVTQRSYYQMAVFVLRAWRIRAGVLRSRMGGMVPEMPEFVMKLQGAMPAQDIKDDISEIKDDGTGKSDPSTAQAAASTVASTSSATLVPTNEDPLLMDELKMVLTPTDPVLDQFLAQPFVDPSSIDWDMWGNIMPPGSGSAFDSFGGIGGNQNSMW